MTFGLQQRDKLYNLLDQLFDDQLDAADQRQLSLLIESNDEALDIYLSEMNRHAALAWDWSVGLEGDSVEDSVEKVASGQPLVASGQWLVASKEGPEVRGQGSEAENQKSEIINHKSIAPNLPPPVSIVLDDSTLLSPLSPLPFYISHPFVFSNLFALLVIGLGALGAWFYQVDIPQPAAQSGRSSTIKNKSLETEQLVFVGRVTGMVDVKWADNNTSTETGNGVPLGRKYALASGLMEITYNTGAKVILQGPATYEVDSRAGGFLAVGKLTAKLEKKPSAVSGQRSGKVASGQPLVVSEVNPKSQISKSQISNPLPSPAPRPQSLAPVFAVRTPTAIVTDLGTEFGVKVNEKDVTTSHVYRGSVKVQAIAADGQAKGDAQVLYENQSAQVEKIDGEAGRQLVVVRRAESEPSAFVRVLPPPRQTRENNAYADLVLSLQPTVYYRMERPRTGEEQLRILDSASGGHHGVLNFDKIGFKDADYTLGRFGDALFFRGANVRDHVLVPDYPKTNNDQLTVSAWVMAVDRSLWPMIVGNWSATSRGHFHFGLFADATQSDLAVSIAQRNREQVYAREGPSHPFPIGQWQHVAFVCDKSEVRLYRNGVEVASTPCDGLLTKPEVPFLSIGSSVADDGVTLKGGFWHGRIDELAIFNRAISANDVRRLCGIGKVSRVNLRDPSDQSATTHEENGLSKKGGDKIHKQHPVFRE